MQRVLSFDGGGIRGILTACLLERIEAARPGFIKDTYLFAGTSTGGILALALAVGASPAELISLYRRHGAEIFRRSWPRRVFDPFAARWAKYDNAALKRHVTGVLGSVRLGGLSSHVVIPAYDLSHNKEKFFHNFQAGDRDELAVDVAMRTSAAPTYFPSYQGYADGGLVDNNPSMAAYTQARMISSHEIALLSIGTGDSPVQALPGLRHDWGGVPWISKGKLVNKILDGAGGMADCQCRAVLGSAYFRLNPPMPENFEMDDVGCILELLRIAQAVELEPVLGWLAHYWAMK